MKITSRKEAKELGLKRYFTGKPCKRGHVSERDTACGRCIDCNSSVYSKRAWQKRKDCPDRKAYMKSYLANYYKEKSSTPDGVEELREQCRKNYARNAQKERERSIKKRKANHTYYYQKCAERRARQKKATPVWFKFETDKVNKIYSKAKELGLEVDHIVPLQSDVVCGLHCFDNMQLLSRSENALKSNREWPDMPQVNDE